MKKTIAFILAFLLCLSLCACGADNNGDQTQNDNSTSATDDAKTAATKAIIIDLTWWPIHGGWGIGTTTTSDGHLSEGGYYYGTWEVHGDTVLFITKSADLETTTTTEYQLKSYNDIYFLVGDTQTLASVENHKLPSQVPTTSAEITLDNWQEYFEIVPVNQLTIRTDLWGNVTEDNHIIYILKLKDEYAPVQLPCVSAVDLRCLLNEKQEINGMKSQTICRRYVKDETSDTPQLGYDPMIFYGYEIIKVSAEETSEPVIEILEIQGTLYFIDIA